MFLATAEGLWSTLRAAISHAYLLVASLGGPGVFSLLPLQIPLFCPYRKGMTS